MSFSELRCSIHYCQVLILVLLIFLQDAEEAAEKKREDDIFWMKQLSELQKENAILKDEVSEKEGIAVKEKGDVNFLGSRFFLFEELTLSVFCPAMSNSCGNMIIVIITDRQSLSLLVQCHSNNYDNSYSTIPEDETTADTCSISQSSTSMKCRGLWGHK